MRHKLRFYFGNELHELDSCAPTLTLLDWLRLEMAKTGTKEGCAEGDCGACTIVVGRLEAGRLTYRALNACILFLPTLDGCQILSVEHLKAGRTLHPVQQALVDFHGSQCGFCTPGIVMSLFALWLNQSNPDIGRIEDVLAGNLCRCTGYRPIIDAAMSLRANPDRDLDPWLRDHADMQSKLLALADDETLSLQSAEGRFLSPATLPDLARLVLQEPQAILVAGATDVGLWVTKGMQQPNVVIALNRVEALTQIHASAQETSFGAMVPLTKLRDVMGAMHPQIDELLRRFGSEQVRNSGTIGGNIANGSPIGDLPPVLIAMNARVVLQRGETERSLPLEAFFLDYKKQDRQQGEFVTRIIVPGLAPQSLFHVSKITKRMDEDISAVCGAFWLELRDGRVLAARLAFGGMAAVPKRAAKAEAALVGEIWSHAAAQAAAHALDLDFSPLDDWRASAAYRRQVAANLLKRLAFETLQPEIQSRTIALGVAHA
ncbi:MAG: xanthine dehydrogenase small subunit [Hyphomicrobiales bacterium]|nr:xanthine dehydrogenase small subunit [Hyphomicrobiales bacterium]MDE2116183.1 xanthine dehydrogenase small subunit [Hyphomicrobiales bacterium]